MQSDRPTTAASDAPDDVVRGYFDALNASDTDAIVSLFAEDATVHANGFPTATGREALRAMFGRAFAATSMRMDVSIDTVTTSGAVAIVRSHSLGTVTVLDPGTTFPQHNREIYVLRRTENGWRITDYMFNSPSAAWRRSMST